MHLPVIPLKSRFKSVRICASVPSNLAREGKKLALSHRISFSSYITMLLEHDLSDRKSPGRPIPSAGPRGCAAGEPPRARR
jgi:hypothetical protein